LNSNKLLPPILGLSYNDSVALLKTQEYIFSKSGKHSCKTKADYPSTLMQIPTYIQLGKLQDIVDFIKKSLRVLDAKSITDSVTSFTDDLQIYENLREKYRNVAVKENILDVNKIRGQARIRDLKNILYNIRTNSSFIYLDYGGMDGGVTNEIAKYLKLRKNNTFCLDIESWFGNVYDKPYKEITYRLVKPNTSLPFADNSVDLITCFQVLHHINIKELDFYVKELIRILKPGGIFIIREHDCNDYNTRLLIDIEHTLFETVTSEKINGHHLFEYKDSDNYRNIEDWVRYFQYKNLRLINYPDLYSRVSGYTRYTYRVFTK
jgi:SAM-dependent methyltransferase